MVNVTTSSTATKAGNYILNVSSQGNTFAKPSRSQIGLGFSGIPIFSDTLTYTDGNRANTEVGYDGTFIPRKSSSVKGISFNLKIIPPYGWTGQAQTFNATVANTPNPGIKLNESDCTVTSASGCVITGEVLATFDNNPVDVINVAPASESQQSSIMKPQLNVQYKYPSIELSTVFPSTNIAPGIGDDQGVKLMFSAKSGSFGAGDISIPVAVLNKTDSNFTGSPASNCYLQFKNLPTYASCSFYMDLSSKRLPFNADVGSQSFTLGVGSDSLVNAKLNITKVSVFVLPQGDYVKDSQISNINYNVASAVLSAKYNGVSTSLDLDLPGSIDYGYNFWWFLNKQQSPYYGLNYDVPKYSTYPSTKLPVTIENKALAFTRLIGPYLEYCVNPQINGNNFTTMCKNSTSGVWTSEQLPLQILAKAPLEVPPYTKYTAAISYSTSLQRLAYSFR